MRSRKCFLLLIGILISIPIYASAQAPFAEESTVQTALRVAVFRYMFKHYDYGAHVKVICISTERPLPDEFVKRFSDNKLPVVWSSECSIDALSGVKENKTGRQGLLMAIQRIHWTSGGEVELDVEAYSDGLAANWNRLTVVNEDGQWVVKKDKLTGIS